MAVLNVILLILAVIIIISGFTYVVLSVYSIISEKPVIITFPIWTNVYIEITFHEKTLTIICYGNKIL